MYYSFANISFSERITDQRNDYTQARKYANLGIYSRKFSDFFFPFFYRYAQTNIHVYTDVHTYRYICTQIHTHKHIRTKYDIHIDEIYNFMDITQERTQK